MNTEEKYVKKILLKIELFLNYLTSHIFNLIFYNFSMRIILNCKDVRELDRLLSISNRGIVGKVHR